jgi:hypothetical protein
MLPHFFFDWWFAPWGYAVNAPGHLPLAADLLGQRDGYRLWCEQARVTADLPETFDAGWQVVLGANDSELIATARLFAGLLAAREHNQSALAELPFADRKWCVSVAATQPLRSCEDVAYAAGDSIEVRGMFELARRLEHGFSGLWSRLRLILSPALAARVDSLLLDAAPAAESAGTSSTRAQRCWTLCRARVSSADMNGQNDADTNDASDDGELEDDHPVTLT